DALKHLREALGWSQAELAGRAGIKVATLSDYETGRMKHALERSRLDGLAALMGAPPWAVESILAALESVRAAAPATDSGAELSPDLRAGLEQAAAKIARLVRRDLLAAGRALLHEAARAQAAEVWAVLRPMKREADRRLAIAQTPGYATWALVERLAHESERAAAHDADQALGLAALALHTADLAPGPAPLRAAAREYAWVYVGNARRVKGLHAAAWEALARAKEEAAAAGELERSPFSRALMLDREASLYRDQRRFPEALALSERALALGRQSEHGFLWLNRAFMLQQAGDAEAALGALREAFAALDERSEPRLYWGAIFNLAATLLDLGRGGEATGLLPRVRALAEERRDALDLLRVLWLEGLAAAVGGDSEAAAAALNQVWRDFAARDMAYDAALAALDLAAVQLTAGHPAETRSLALQTAAIFRALDIEREGLAAVRLFLAAALQERATAEQAVAAHSALKAVGPSDSVGG
ncbi:MAG TPA: helix-turn-helix domain-containing protein, partial [Thermoanaerobaculia bacterium]|nr:helix-turn-helix domain-containing protein [Thermoanaerobaculia bacterium]